MPFLNPGMTQFRFTMRLYSAFWSLVAFGAAILLAGCIGEPRTYYAAKPIVLQQPAVARISKRSAPSPSAPALAPVLSADEKQQLFQNFQASQGLKDPVVTAPGAAP